jgi:hypothetical protein
MQNWYNSLNRNQQIFFMVISFVSILAYVGLVLTPLAIFLELGRPKNTEKEDPQDDT